MISNEFAGIVLAWDKSLIYAKHLSKMCLMSRDVGSNCCFSRELTPLVLCCDFGKPFAVLGRWYHCPFHVLLREAGGQSSQEHMCPQQFQKREKFHPSHFTMNLSWCVIFFQTVNFKFAIDSAFENQC